MKIGLTILAVVLLLALAVPVANLVIGGPRDTALTKPGPTEPSTARVAAILESRCASCHVDGLEVPFYARVPGASALIRTDVERGLASLNLVAALVPDAKAAQSEVALAKIERQIRAGEMPPARYLALHWNAAVRGRDKEAVADWIRETRVALYAPGGLPREVASRPVHPLPARVEVDPRKASLGRRLYHDKRFSGDMNLSCATCHDLAKGGTDQEKVSTGMKGQKGGINAPTTFNSGFQFVQFWDGRAATLEEQAAGPPENPVEMGGKFEDILARLDADETFKAEFTEVYPEGFTKATVTHAIAEFERTLVTPGARFDLYLLGSAEALTPVEARGWSRFEELGCPTCHVGRLLGGRSFETMGRKADYFKDRCEATPADLGRFNVTKDEADRHRFKVPTLRNIALTWPYFHDGSASDLAQAVKVMGEYQVGVRLTDADTDAIVAFLKTLTGTYQGKPL